MYVITVGVNMIIVRDPSIVLEELVNLTIAYLLHVQVELVCLINVLKLHVVEGVVSL
jgi:hypothetical protein